MKSNKWSKFFSYYKKYLSAFLWDMFFSMLGAAIMLIIPLIVRHITYHVIYYETELARREILRLGLLCLVLIAVEYLCNFWTTYYGHRMGSRMEYDLRAELFAHYQKLSFSFFDDRKVGHLMSRVTTDLFEICELFHHGPEDLAISVIKLIGSFIILFFINWKLALCAFVFVPPMIIYAIMLNKKMKLVYKKNRKRIAEINGQIEENLSGIRVVKSFANEEIEEQKFKKGNDGFLESKRENYLLMAQYFSGINGFTTLLNLIVVIVGAYFITGQMIPVTDLVTFLLYIGNVTEPIRKLVAFTEQYQNGMSGFDRFMEMMNIMPDIEDSPDAVDAGDLKGKITFKDVSFRYENTLQDVLSHIDLEIEPGEYIALIGPSGVGKTTLCSLIPRFYDVTEGAILIDDRDIRNYTQKSLRRNIGIVQQDVYLFSGDVMENIRYGRPDATDEEIILAARRANAHDFIMELPEGYHTDIGQRGVKLSGGQKQRLSIARVFLKDPPILIFDEATSSLDNKSEKVVQKSLENLAKDRTTLVIAHRLSTIRMAKRILVLSENGIAEEGTHDELLAKNGIYATLYRLQFPEELEEMLTGQEDAAYDE
ncbi:MAG: ABC transporter ATP-binding protein [Flexilinea sp.]|nr:ABC transporter ATP-binding protein [Flexilinea sp.]